MSSLDPVILGWDWNSSHDLRFLYPRGALAGTGLTSGLDAPLQRSAPPALASAQTLIIHGEFRRMIRKIVPADAAETIDRPAPAPPLPLAPWIGSWGCL
jgi:hypothetical protein